MNITRLTRRQAFRLAGAGALALHAGAAPSGKPLRGIFPIAQTPFLDNGGLDVETLAARAAMSPRSFHRHMRGTKR